ncbi:flavonol sulfotransferase-like protein [Trifolium medium]|uniref:Flavonol sulfotransferase-like protein n=1 Tax=Trifolium medium TaxID=97028 RepID=A0A392QMW3_9FABA|nr:flavonol sulfotransferase-like protein [Trifolium medium]
MDTASKIWKELKDQFYQGDVFRISDIQEEIYTLKQGVLQFDLILLLSAQGKKANILLNGDADFRHFVDCVEWNYLDIL